MAERSRKKPIDPKFLRCQVAFKALSDEILEEKPDIPQALFGLSINTDPTEILERLKHSSLRDILSKPNELYPDLGLIAEEVPAHSISLIHGDWQEEKYRYDPESPRERPYKVKRFPGEFNWTRQIAIRIWYGGDSKTSQELFVNDCLRDAGVTPSISRAIYALEYAEQGYEGHNQKQRRFRSQKEAMFFINLARELFDKREV